MAVSVPKQSVPPCDNLPDSSGNSALLSKPWWLFFNAVAQVLNSASVAEADNLVTLNGGKVTY